MKIYRPNMWLFLGASLVAVALWRGLYEAGWAIWHVVTGAWAQ